METVASPNAKEFDENFLSERLAINAILSLDAFFGILYQHLKEAGEPTVAGIGRDDGYRDTVAAKIPAYQVLRDTAFAIKHGGLTGKKPRLVSRADQLGERPVVLGEFFLDYDYLDGTAVFIETADGRSERAAFIVAQVAAEAEALLNAHGI